MAIRLRRGHRRAAFWGTVALVSVLANTGFNILSDRFPQLQALRDWNNYHTRRTP